jgi:hypothetical protein
VARAPTLKAVVAIAIIMLFRSTLVSPILTKASAGAIGSMVRAQSPTNADGLDQIDRHATGSLVTSAIMESENARFWMNTTVDIVILVILVLLRALATA